MNETVRIKVGDKVTWRVRARWGGELLKAKVVEIEHIYKDGTVRVTGFPKIRARFRTGWPLRGEHGDGVKLMGWGASGYGRACGRIYPHRGETQEELDAEIAGVKAEEAAKAADRQAGRDAHKQKVLRANLDRFGGLQEMVLIGDLHTLELVSEAGHQQRVIFAVEERAELDWRTDEEYTEYVIRAQVYGQGSWGDSKRWHSIERKGRSVREALEGVAVAIW